METVRILEYVLHVSTKPDASQVSIIAGTEVVLKVFNKSCFYMTGIQGYSMFQLC